MVNRVSRRRRALKGLLERRTRVFEEYKAFLAAFKSPSVSKARDAARADPGARWSPRAFASRAPGRLGNVKGEAHARHEAFGVRGKHEQVLESPETTRRWRVETCSEPGTENGEALFSRPQSGDPRGAEEEKGEIVCACACVSHTRAVSLSFSLSANRECCGAREYIFEFLLFSFFLFPPDVKKKRFPLEKFVSLSPPTRCWSENSRLLAVESRGPSFGKDECERCAKMSSFPVSLVSLLE